MAHPASCRSTPSDHGSMCMATCTTLQAAWCLCPHEWRFPLEKEALCQHSRWAGTAAAGRPCMIITWAYCLQQCQKGHLAVSCLCSGLLLSQLFPEAGCIKGAGSTDGSGQWALPSIHHQWGKWEVPQGLETWVIFLSLSGAPFESSQAEPLLLPLICTGFSAT